MNVLVLGSGGREHAIAWKINQSDLLQNLFVAPGNPGTAEFATNIDLSLGDFDGIAAFVQKEKIELVVVGPEAPLVDGIVDYFSKNPSLQSVNIIGPDSVGAQLEGSKDFAKAFMQEFSVPTAKYKTFTAENIEQGYTFLDELDAPFVLKADGLAGGKGVLILADREEAKEELKNMLLDQKFGQASKQVVIEEFLDGIEMSVFILTDGNDYLMLPSAKDYKRIGEGDTGLNTGGMGAVSPVPFVNPELEKRIEESIVIPTVKGIKERGFNYKGFVFIGLMIKDNMPYVIEYNVRMGDPETEVVMPRITSDFLQHLKDCATGNMNAKPINISHQHACTVMLVSGGYPESYPKGKKITGINNTGKAILFHAGTRLEKEELLTNGGRVMAITNLEDDLKEAITASIKVAEKIEFEGKYYRRDIGKDVL